MRATAPFSPGCVVGKGKPGDGVLDRQRRDARVAGLMGMFDTLLVEVPLPDGYAAADFQTKCFECDLDTYVIDAAGELWKRNEPWWEDEEAKPERVAFHGVLNFYDYDDKGLAPLAEHDDARWHEYDAKFTDGRLVEITQRPPLTRLSSLSDEDATEPVSRGGV